MTETQDQRKSPQNPDNKAQGAKPLAHLEAQRAKNLRDNLAKRKAQARSRQDTQKS